MTNEKAIAVRRNFQFESINRGILWSKLSLTTAQLAALCNLTTRQVSYWAQKGYLPHAAHSPERFNGNAVDMCLLIKQAMDNGATLVQAARLAQEHLAAEFTEQPPIANFNPPALFDVYEKLLSIESTARIVRMLIELQLPRAKHRRAAPEDASETAARASQVPPSDEEH